MVTSKTFINIPNTKKNNEILAKKLRLNLIRRKESQLKKKENITKGIK
jgi:hypothetical protein